MLRCGLSRGKEGPTASDSPDLLCSQEASEPEAVCDCFAF